MKQVQPVRLPHVNLMCTSMLPSCLVSASCLFHLSSCYHYGHGPTPKKKKNQPQTFPNGWRQCFCIGYCHVHSFWGGRKNSCSSLIKHSCTARCRTWAWIWTQTQARVRAWPVFQSWFSSTHRYRSEFRSSWHTTKESVLLHNGICSTGRCNIKGNASKRSAAWLKSMYGMLQICCPLEVRWLYWRQATVPILYAALTFL